ncbi:MAG: hypothetical protein HY954_07895 [Deltaproteobacteria bacterium]|nr:hypothetical protein [Deltaproteobacteria bacterium]
MEMISFGTSQFAGRDYFRSGGSPRRGVLLREPERCGECNKVFISLYPLKRCTDHEDLDEL